MPKYPAPLIVTGTVATDGSGDYSGKLSDIVGSPEAFNSIYGYLVEVELLGSAAGSGDINVYVKRDMTGAGTAFGSDLLDGDGDALALNSATVGVSLPLTKPRLISGHEDLYLILDEQTVVGTQSYVVRLYFDARGMDS